MPELLPYAPGTPEWLAARPPVKLIPWSRTGMIHGAYAHSWMYRRGFARAFLAARHG